MVGCYTFYSQHISNAYLFESTHALIGAYSLYVTLCEWSYLSFYPYAYDADLRVGWMQHSKVWAFICCCNHKAGKFYFYFVLSFFAVLPYENVYYVFVAVMVVMLPPPGACRIIE